MKTLSTELQALLASRTFFRCDLVEIVLRGGGGTLRYAAGDCDVLHDGHRYVCGGMTGPYWDRSSEDGNKSTVHTKLGTEVDTLTIDMIPHRSTLLGMAWPRAVRLGLLRGAWFRRLSAYAPVGVSAASWPLVPTGVVQRFVGEVGEIDSGDTAITLTINSPLARLQRQWPRNFYSPTCNNTLGDAACGVDLAALRVEATVAAGSTGAVVLADASGETGAWNLGTLTVTSGELAGLSRSIRTFTAGSPAAIALTTPLPQPLAAGDGLVLGPGCDNTTGPKGCPRFANLAKLRACLFVPAPTTVS